MCPNSSGNLVGDIPGFIRDSTRRRRISSVIRCSRIHREWRSQRGKVRARRAHATESPAERSRAVLAGGNSLSAGQKLIVPM